ncbi:acyltransferase [Rhodopirellula sp.]|nr:acyltransferase [Rhodopirellula sp.]
MPKELIKSTLRGFAILAISPLLLSHWLSSSISGADRSLESHSQLLSLFPGITGNYLRLAFYRFALEQCDPTATICFGALLSKTGARLGRHVYVGPRCMLGLVTLEDDVLLGPAVQIPSGPMTHGIERLDTPIRLQPGNKQRVTVESDTWIGANTLILANIGAQTIVGAGSLVTKDVSSCIIAVGNPAKLIRRRDANA